MTPRKYTVRSIKNKEISVELEETALVSELIEKVCNEWKPDFFLESSILVHAGKIFKPEDELNNYKINEKDKIVIMVKKKAKVAPKPAPAPAPVVAPAAAVEAPVETPAKEEKPVEEVKEEETKEELAPAAPATVEASSTPGDYTDQVGALLELGFGEEEALDALTKTNGNVDLAGAYLLHKDVPDNIGLDEEGDEDSEVPADHPLAELFDSDIFAQMKEQVRRDPSTLANIIHTMARNNPELAAAVEANEVIFTKKLLGSEIYNMLLRSQLGDAGEAGQGQAAAPPRIQVNLEPKDKEAVARLVELGFSEGECIQAYLVCEKNEMLAANLLFEGFN